MTTTAEYETYRDSWTTHDEVVFIKTLTPRKRMFDDPPTRLELLKRYKEAMKTRDRWEGMDPTIISAVVKQEIKNEREKKKGG